MDIFSFNKALEKNIKRKFGIKEFNKENEYYLINNDANLYVIVNKSNSIINNQKRSIYIYEADNFSKLAKDFICNLDYSINDKKINIDLLLTKRSERKKGFATLSFLILEDFAKNNQIESIAGFMFPCSGTDLYSLDSFYKKCGYNVDIKNISKLSKDFQSLKTYTFDSIKYIDEYKINDQIKEENEIK